MAERIVVRVPEEEYHEFLDRRLDHLREVVKKIEKSVMYCSTDVVYDWGRFISFSRSFHEAGTFFRSMEDITEEDWEKYKKRLAEIRDKAGKIIGTFAIHCVCKVKVE